MEEGTTRHATGLSPGPLASPTPTEEHYASDLGDSFFVTGVKTDDRSATTGANNLSESSEQDKPRQAGMFGLLNQLYELNNSAM
jgi:hypothetical protein